MALPIMSAAAGACASGGDRDARLAALQGARADAVTEALGAPTRKDAASDGRMLWTYYQSSTRAVARDYGVPGFTDAPRGGEGRDAVVFVCIVTVRFNAEGLVDAVNSDGEHC